MNSLNLSAPNKGTANFSPCEDGLSDSICEDNLSDPPSMGPRIFTLLRQGARTLYPPVKGGKGGSSLPS